MTPGLRPINVTVTNSGNKVTTGKVKKNIIIYISSFKNKLTLAKGAFS